MKKVRLFSIFFVFWICISTALALSGTASASDSISVAAEYAYLADPKSGEVLYAKNEDVQATPASLTKIMTALIILEHADLTETATVSSSALADLHPDSSTANLKVGEEMLMDDILKCILIASANDACNVAAEHIAGSIDAFVDMMNERAAQLGCENTHFANTHGLTEDGHYSSVRDMYTITLEAIKNEKFLEICNTASVTIPATNKSDERTYYTTNHLISRLKSPDYIYHYAKGIKTGHTSAAGYCLVSSAEKDDLYLIAVVMNSIKDEETGLIMSFVDSKNLYEWAFDNFSYQTMLSSSSPVSEVSVLLAEDTDYVAVNPASEISALLPNDFDIANIEYDIEIFEPEGIVAPVLKGDVLGKITVSYEGREYGSTDLVALNSVNRDVVLYKVDQVKTFLSQTWVRYTILGIVVLIVLYTIFVIVYNARRRQRRRSSSYRGGRRRR